MVEKRLEPIRCHAHVSLSMRKAHLWQKVVSIPVWNCHHQTKILLNNLRYLRLDIHDELEMPCLLPCRSMQIFSHLCSTENSRLLPCFWMLSPRTPLMIPMRAETWKVHCFFTCFKHHLFFNVPTFFVSKQKEHVLSSRQKMLLHPYNQRTEDLFLSGGFLLQNPPSM